ncbi:MAG: N-acetyltransferase [bacterium]|nr:N-acetyltransferase [bacterium]
MEKPFFAHEKAIVDSDNIGKGTKIWAFTHVLKGAQIGEDCNIGEGCFIETHSIIGNNVIIKNNISVWDKITIEDDCFLGPNVVLTNVINPRSLYKRGVEGFTSTLIKKGATIGANATIVCGNTLGEHCFIGAGAVVTKDIPDYAIVVGNPSKLIGYACRCGEKIDFNIPCAECGRKYELSDEKGCYLV